jgi:ketosteroid isomerase-like protein
MKKMFLFTSLLVCANTYSQLRDEIAIRRVLNDQTKSWNRGDVEGFMRGYWKNDSLIFVGKSGVNWGWKRALENYKKRYPDTTAMGKLSFDFIVIKRLSPEYYYVVGKWMLTRTVGDLSGHYDLLFKRIHGIWLIVADHSS